MRDEKLAKLAALKPGDIMTCGACGVVVGRVEDVNGQLWLCVGTVTLEMAHGRCSKCQCLWRFDSGDIQLARLIFRPAPPTK